MGRIQAFSISIGVLGGIATWLTATLILLPVWVVFIAWASFFILGGNFDGFKRSVCSNLMGCLIASLTLVTISMAGESPIVSGICVGVGSAAMVQASAIPWLSAIPAIVWGFASTVGTTVILGTPMPELARSFTTLSTSNPALITGSALILGGVFGWLSEVWGDLMTKEGSGA